MKHTVPDDLVRFAKIQSWTDEQSKEAFSFYETNGFYELPGGSGFGALPDKPSKVEPPKGDLPKDKSAPAKNDPFPRRAD